MLHPEEIDNQQFEVSFRGYNTREVDEFLNKISMDLEEMIKEQDSLRRKIAATELIAKEARDHEEEFIASMKADMDLSQANLQTAKAEGERIIREAKNAASGIMTEVRRRAVEISNDSKRASEELTMEAKNAAEAILADAEKRSKDKLFAANTEAENIVKAAIAHAAAIEEEARRNSTAAAAAAVTTASACEEYIKEIRTAADSICRELDIELKNSAARISLLGKRIAAMDVSIPPVLNEDEPIAEELLCEEPEADEEPFVEEQSESLSSVTTEEGGYFTKEYRQVMEELFGEDEGSVGGALEDDDTYDYLEKPARAKAVGRIAEALEEEEDIIDSNEVTDEYEGVAASQVDELGDLYNTDEIDRIFKSPSAEDIDDIMNDY